MKPMKCRLWDKINKKMVYYDKDCSAPDITLNGVLISHNKQSNVSYQYEPLRFTGLCDRRGVEAYAEDLYKISGSDKIYHISRDFDYRQMAEVETHFKYCRAEIIGNVFQDKDLLKEKP